MRWVSNPSSRTRSASGSLPKASSTARGADRAILLVTHYQRLLDYVKPDRVHVLARGRIVKSGGPELAAELEEKGYGWLENAA